MRAHRFGKYWKMFPIFDADDEFRRSFKYFIFHVQNHTFPNFHVIIPFNYRVLFITNFQSRNHKLRFFFFVFFFLFFFFDFISMICQRIPKMDLFSFSPIKILLDRIDIYFQFQLFLPSFRWIF